MPDDNKESRKAVYAIVEREGAKARWIRVGIAFTNRDGSLNLILDAVPVNGRLHVREFTESDAPEPNAAEPAATS